MVSSQTDRNAITAFCREPIFVMQRAKIARLFLQWGSMGDNEPTRKNVQATWLYWLSYMRRRQVPSSKRCFGCHVET
jgi:hypothetical protein